MALGNFWQRQDKIWIFLFFRCCCCRYRFVSSSTVSVFIPLRNVFARRSHPKKFKFRFSLYAHIVQVGALHTVHSRKIEIREGMRTNGNQNEKEKPDEEKFVISKRSTSAQITREGVKYCERFRAGRLAPNAHKFRATKRKAKKCKIYIRKLFLEASIAMRTYHEAEFTFDSGAHEFTWCAQNEQQQVIAHNCVRRVY